MSVGFGDSGQQVAQSVMLGLLAFDDNPVPVGAEVHFIADSEGGFLRQRFWNPNGQTVSPLLDGSFHDVSTANIQELLRVRQGTARTPNPRLRFIFGANGGLGPSPSRLGRPDPLGVIDTL